MRSLVQRGVLVLAGVVGLLGTRPATANAQKALVYCPVAIDATGCNAIVNALTGPAFPLGVERGYDGTGGTVDLKAVDLFSYSVFVVPSLADDASSQPYATLRDPEVVEHLKAALIGRIAMWSGSPDQGATNRALKDALIQNLAGWAAGAFATAKGPGLVALLDASSSATSRYDWVRAITPASVTSDPNLLIYSSVRALNARATAILTSGAGAIAYDNMATFGFQVPNGAPGVSLDALGQTGTTQGGQVVLLTMEAGNASGATVKTDRDDYAPGETVTITGTGWQAGETVKLALHMDPLRDSDTELTATADASGNFTNADFAPAAYDVGVRFVLTALGQTSGRRAQTTFTDGPTDFGVDISPIAATSGGAQSYTLRVWNASNNASNEIGSANVTVPAGWTVTTPLATPTAAPNAKTWTAALVSSVIQLRATANSQRLGRTNGSNPADTIKLVFTATAPVVASATPYTWATVARTANDFTGTDWTQTSANAVVTVSPAANAATTTTPSAAIATYGDASVNLSATVTSTSTVNTGTVTFTVKQGATTIGSATTSSTVTAGNASVTYALPAGTPAGPYTIEAVYNPGSGFDSSTGTASLTIDQKTVTPNVTVSNKIYDGTTAATILTRTLTGVLAADVGNVTLTGGTATFADKNVGTSKTVNVTGLSLTGTAAGNYVLSSTSATATADITARTLVVSAVGVNKVYDGTTAATVTLSDDRVLGDAFTTSYTAATFADKNVGTAKPINVTGISISGTDAGNYTFNTTCATAADITAKAITGNFTANNKVYDGTNAAIVDTRALTGAVSGDDVSLTGGTATFADKNVGTGKTVTLTGAVLSGADAGNYALTSVATTTANITARALLISATGVNKVYDGTTAATVTLSDDRVSGDVFTDSYTTATFADKNVGTGKTVSVAGISISGTDAGNYTFNTTANTTADITARALTVTAAGVNKVYDATTNATVTLSDDRVAGDVFTDSYTSASFADKNVGTGKAVSVSGISISGTDAGNYTFNTTATTTANITARALAVTATGVNKIYDGTTAATVTFSDDRVAGDVFTVSGSASFGNKNVGTGKTVSVTGIALTGADAGNYTPNTTTSTTADITARALTVSATGVNKTYDGTTAATVNLSDDRVLGDVLSVAYATAVFADKNVGTGKAVSVTGISVTGADAANYTFNTTAATTADITAKALLVTATAQDKTYDGTDAATVTLSDDRLSGDVFTANYATATFSDKNAGAGKTVTVSGISLTGADAGNYTPNATALATASINQRALTITATGQNKVYDGTTAATVTLTDDRVAGDVFTDSYAAAAFNDKNAGTGKPVSVSGISISGVDAGNYTFNTTANTTADITQKSITGSFTTTNKVYDGTTAAAVVTRSLSGNIVGDDVSLTGGTATFADKNVGTGKTVTLSGASLSGADAANYFLSLVATTTADITPRALTITATGLNKVYDGTTAATVTLSDDRVAGDNLTTAYASASFADKNVGTAKPVSVSGISLTGSDAGNYTFNTSATTTADITARALTVSATGVNKVYDGNATATVTLSDDRVSGDVFTDSYTSAAFNNKHVGTAKPVSVSGISISGTDAGNYTFNTTANTTAEITARPLTVTATGVNKVYDGTTAATVTYSDDRLSGDVFSVSGSASFADKNVGVGKPISVTGIALSGADAANYAFNTTASASADITQRALTVTATGINKEYDGTTVATVTLSDNRVAGDVLTTAYGSAAFADANVGTAKPVSVSGITVTGADAGNYTFNTTAATTADITRKALTIKADDKSHVFNTVVFPGPYTATFTGLVPSDETGGQPNAGVVTGLTYGGAAITAINAGTYPIVPSGATATNYTITQLNGTLTILDQSAPIVSAVTATPNPVAMGNAFVLAANISDVTTGNSNITVAEYSTNGGSTWAPMNSFTSAPSVNVTKTLTLGTGVYNVCVRGTDAPGNTSLLTANSCTLVAVYDPTAGFVTGGGWILSPKGAYVPNLNLEGKATFGFVSKYQKGQTKPSGSTEFQFHASGMNFKSVDYEWLVISGTTRAQYKGTGTINGAGNYGFLLSAIDGDNYGSKKPDMFRIKIWEIATGTVVYDNQMGADDVADPTMIISGGSIQIQSK